MTPFLRPFFTFYGGKWRAAVHYPEPMHRTIVEPFAGSAGYSLRYPHRQVVLIERDPIIAGTWRYLLRVTPEEVLGLPDVEPGQSVDDLPLTEELRWLVGWWVNFGGTAPGKTLSSLGRSGPRGDAERYAVFWGPKVRERIAAQLPAIRHWRLIEGDWSEAPDAEATWFVDPPYAEMGKYYRYGSARLDFAALAAWCRIRRGQVIVCENDGADWLPFKHFRDLKTSDPGGRVSREATWTAGCPVQAEMFA